MTRDPGPRLAVDIIIECYDKNDKFQGIVLIERKYEPKGWAIPGGHVDTGETIRQAAVREAKEETGLDVTLLAELPYRDDPNRDPRYHVVSHVFRAKAYGTPNGMDDAINAACFLEKTLPKQLAFDHEDILKEYFKTYHPL